jgi:Arc/MetJ-type ribon-helix-helix transcriptional regulator
MEVLLQIGWSNIYISYKYTKIMAQLIHMRIEDALHAEIKSFVEAGKFATQSEFIKTAVRSYLSDIHKEEAYKAITKLHGSMKGKRPTQEERAQAVKDYEKSGRNIFTELGLK